MHARRCSTGRTADHRSITAPASAGTELAPPQTSTPAAPASSARYKVQVRIEVVDVFSGQVADSAVVEGKSGIVTLGE